MALSPLAIFLSHGLHGLTLSLGYLSLCYLTEALRHPWPKQELKLPHGLILTLTEVLDLTKAPSPELDSHHGHGQELSSSHPLIHMAPYLTGLMMCEAMWGLVFG